MGRGSITIGILLIMSIFYVLYCSCKSYASRSCHKPNATIGAGGNGATTHEQEGMVVNEEPQGYTKWRAHNVV